LKGSRKNHESSEWIVYFLWCQRFGNTWFLL
jgi:hypothetical protein